MPTEAHAHNHKQNTPVQRAHAKCFDKECADKPLRQAPASSTSLSTSRQLAAPQDRYSILHYYNHLA